MYTLEQIKEIFNFTLEDWIAYFNDTNNKSEYCVINFSLLECREYPIPYLKYYKQIEKSCRNIAAVVPKIIIELFGHYFQEYYSIKTKEELDVLVDEKLDRFFLNKHIITILRELESQGRAVIIEDTESFIYKGEYHSSIYKKNYATTDIIDFNLEADDYHVYLKPIKLVEEIEAIAERKLAKGYEQLTLKGF